jgi:phosphoribosylglycinamide formyltransferase-1
MKERSAYLISGAGTTMSKAIESSQSGELNSEISAIIASNQDCGGIKKALDLGIPKKDIIVINPKDFKNKEGVVDQQAFGQKIINELEIRKTTSVLQLGWLALTPSIVIDHYQGKIFNQHPGNPNNFGGKGMFGIRVFEAELNYFLITGREPYAYMVTQRVAKNFDEGKIIRSVKVDIFTSDTAEILQSRCLPYEYENVIHTLKELIEGSLTETVLPKITDPKDLEILNQCKKAAIEKY